MQPHQRNLRVSSDLIAFLKDWYHWATNGAPEGEPFARWDGLCCAAKWNFPDVEAELGRNLRRKFPFGKRDYWNRFENGTQHECPKRLAWVKARLIEANVSI